MNTHVKVALVAFGGLAVSIGCGVDPVAMRTKVEKVLDNPAAQMVLCYQKELLRDRNLKGQVEISFTVLPGSKAIQAVKVVSSNLNNPALEQCAADQVARLSFPFDPKVRLNVIWPFEFSPL
jgi:outer membrane biosynthesis protein TonB